MGLPPPGAPPPSLARGDLFQDPRILAFESEPRTPPSCVADPLGPGLRTKHCEADSCSWPRGV